MCLLRGVSVRAGLCAEPDSAFLPFCAGILF
jgi:hypothetical protein